MPAIVACAACQTKLKVPENSSAKALRCPKCKGIVPIAPPKPKPPPPKEEEFEVNEAAEEKEEEFEVNEAANEQEEEFEVNEAADMSEDDEEEEEDEDEEDEEEEPDEDSALVELGFAKVKDVFKKGNIPDDARKAIEKAFSKKEKALWAGRPSAELIASKAWIGLVFGPILVLLGLASCIGLSAVTAIADQMPIKIICAVVALIFGGMFMIGGVLMVVFRKRIAGNVNASYVLTNKRAYIYEGNVRAFNAAQLEKMRVEPSSKFEGAGDLVFAYDFMGQGVNVSKEEADRHRQGGQSTAVGFLNIENVQTVKQLINEILLEPALAKAEAKKKKKKAKKDSKNKKLFG